MASNDIRNKLQPSPTEVGRVGRLWTIIRQDGDLELARLKGNEDNEGFYFRVW